MMGLDPLIIGATAGKWLWDSYGKDISDNAIEQIRKKWSAFKWEEAQTKYCDRLKSLSNTVRVLGNPKPINLDEIFTDVYVLDRPTAFRRFDIREIQSGKLEEYSLQIDEQERKPALDLVLQNKRLFILGKPGAGKTTFLKYLVLKAVEGGIPKTPIFISLKEWTDSKIDLITFIEKQFEVCAFPKAKEFIDYLLTRGHALVLFDGLDEVNIGDDKRVQTISTLTNFAKQYPEVNICLTCRIAATDYSFDLFTYVEIADFTEKQQNTFIDKWYQENQVKRNKFKSEFNKHENKGLRDLAKIPLLLALLCLAYDESFSFPTRKVELYKEAFDALLKKWDASRGIDRDEIYRNLSPMRKEQMLARIAAENYENKDIFISKDKLEKQIIHYLQQLPESEIDASIDGEVVLRAIEAQHGVFIERAHGIYSFSHLTIQEYLTSRYIVDNLSGNTIEKMFNLYLYNDQWVEIFLMTASILDNADHFFIVFLKELDRIIAGSEVNKKFLSWASNRLEMDISNKNLSYLLPNSIFLGFLINAENKGFIRYIDKTSRFYFTNHSYIEVHPNKSRTLDFDTVYKLINSNFSGSLLSDEYYDIRSHQNVIKKLAETLGLSVSKNDMDLYLKFNAIDLGLLGRFFKSSGLFFHTLELATVSNRKGIIESYKNIFME